MKPKGCRPFLRGLSSHPQSCASAPGWWERHQSFGSHRSTSRVGSGLALRPGPTPRPARPGLRSRCVGIPERPPADQPHRPAWPSGGCADQVLRPPPRLAQPVHEHAPAGPPRSHRSLGPPSLRAVRGSHNPPAKLPAIDQEFRPVTPRRHPVAHSLPVRPRPLCLRSG